VALVAPGSAVKVVVVRDKKRVELKITVAERDADTVASTSGSERASLGVSVEESPGAGVVVTGVERDGPAAGSLEEGDVILEVNRRRIESVGDFRAPLSKLRSGDRALMRVRRGDSQLFMAIPVE
jgi:serine protease Do